MGMKPGETIREYRERQYAEDKKTVQNILKCLNGLTFEDVDRVFGCVKQDLRRVKITLPLAEE